MTPGRAEAEEISQSHFVSVLRRIPEGRRTPGHRAGHGDALIAEAV
jgi:hypothetical protein